MAFVEHQGPRSQLDGPVDQVPAVGMQQVQQRGPVGSPDRVPPVRPVTVSRSSTASD
jgi:hypothetical protein